MEEFSRLLELMERLRGDRGCPWDKKQKIESFKTFLLEEVYELIEAIEKDNPDSIKEELGDLLFHIIFIAQICKEEGKFEIKDVLRFTYEKMVRRHPHVFSNEETPDFIPKKWEEIKKKEKRDYSLLGNVPKTLPALLRAYVVTKKVSRVGFDWERIDEVFLKLNEEINELREAERLQNKEKIAEEVGDLLFTVVNISRFYGVDPEDALRSATQKFIDRFSYIEKNLDFNKTTTEMMDRLWEEKKEMEKKRG
jgi:tetrapyrrole methylase family protein/MazG family protein